MLRRRRAVFSLLGKTLLKSPPQQLSKVTFCSKEESGRLTLDVGWATLAMRLMQLALDHCDGIEI